MKQFNLSEWLANPSRKVLTRDGREVTIEKTDIHIHGMSHMILGKYSDIYEIWHINGRINYTGSDCNLDLFFVDEEEELTEFEKMLQYVLECYSGHVFASESEIETLKLNAKSLLDLARKEIEEGAVEFAKSYMEDVNPSFEKVQESEELWKWKMSCLRGINKAYTQGKQDALKSLPKWKKANDNLKLNAIVPHLLDNVLYWKGYYIWMKDLETLQKEE